MALSDDEELIHFLNGFNESVNDAEIYLDKEGMPTDKFLEALKSDVNTTQPLQNDKYHNGKTRVPIDVEYNGDRHFDNIQNNRNDGMILDSPRNNESFKLFKKYHLDQYSTPDAAFDYSSHYSRSGDYVAKLERKVKKKVKVKKVKVTKESRLDSLALPKEDVPNSRDVFAEHMQEQQEVETQTKLKALQLRITGQRNSIKSLEMQLEEAKDLLVARDKQLAQALARLKAVDQTRMQLNRGALSNTTSDPKVRGAEDAADKYKKQAESLQPKLLEEQGRRARAEEKARVLKEYADKHKARSQALEAEVAESRGREAEAVAKAERYRKAYKDLAAEAAANKVTVGERDAEIASQTQKLDRTEATLRNTQMDLEHAREELRALRSEIKTAQAKTRQVGLQRDIAQEREAALRAEKRLEAMEAARQAQRDRRLSDSGVVRDRNASQQRDRNESYSPDMRQFLSSSSNNSSNNTSHSTGRPNRSIPCESSVHSRSQPSSAPHWVSHAQQMSIAENALDREVVTANHRAADAALDGQLSFFEEESSHQDRSPLLSSSAPSYPSSSSSRTCGIAQPYTSEEETGHDSGESDRRAHNTVAFIRSRVLSSARPHPAASPSPAKLRNSHSDNIADTDRLSIPKNVVSQQSLSTPVALDSPSFSSGRSEGGRDASSSSSSRMDKLLANLSARRQ